MVIKNQDINQLLGAGYSVTYEQLNTLIAFLKLWSQFGMWTRALMTSTVGNLENREAVISQLYEISTEMYNTFRIFYGPYIFQQFLNLLNNFITNEWKLIEALENGDNEGADESTVRLYKTADELADLLSRLNVYWEEDQWKSLLYQYIRLMVDEMVALMSGEYEREIGIYKRLDETAELIGNYMARGIIARSTGPENEVPEQS